MATAIGSRRPSTRIGLVLGAGGIVGQAYQAGVLAAVEHDLGWDPRSADLIVGTSAGSVTGALLRLGVPAADLAAFAAEAPLSVEGANVLDSLAAAGDDELPPFEFSSLVRPWELPTWALVRRSLRRPLRFRPGVAAATMLPPGRIDISERASVLDEVNGATLPSGLWICAARRSDGARTVFGRPGGPDATLGEAVSASCAIPGYFAPVRIDGRRYVDGGVHSPTNADVLRDEGLDLVIVVSSMSAARGRAITPDGLLRWAAHRRLARETTRLEEAGTEVVTFEPRGRSLAALGVNAMATDRSAAVAQAAFAEAERRSARPRAAAMLAALG